MKEYKNEKNTSELINPLPDTIPNIVWDDLLYSDKEEILNAVKSNYTITYYHTERQHKKDISLSDDSEESNVSTTGNTDTYPHVNCYSDTDVIKIEKTNGLTTVSSIYSRATSERGVINIENPVSDIIPYDIWNNLPDVLKEEIIKAASQENNHSVVINPPFNIGYNPDEGTISIHSGSGTVSYTDTYDAKRGVLLCGTVSHGL